jgi:magnesium transporter
VTRYLTTAAGTEGTADRADVERLLKGGRLLWLDLVQPQQDDADLLRDVFGVHPLAVEHAMGFGQRPRIETYDEVVYLAAYGAVGFGKDLVEVHVLYAERFLITVRRDGCPAIDEIRGQLRRHLNRPRRMQGPPRLILLHHILDGLIDGFFPALSEFDDRIDDLQQRIFSQPSNDELSELFSMQRWLVAVRKLVAPQRDMMSAVAAGVVSLPAMTARAEPYLRDLYDHLIRVGDLIDSYRDLLSNAMDVYLSTVSNRLNQVMKQLTIIATVFLPLSFLTGFFGQNFSWLVRHLQGIPAFLILGIGTEIAAVAALFIVFRRRGWL